MSAIVKTITPFIDREILIRSLENLGCKCNLNNNEIITNRLDFYGYQKFVFESGRYVFYHDSSAEYNSPYFNNNMPYRWDNINNQEYKSTREFLKAVEKEYITLYKQKLEELEKQRLEDEKRRIEEEKKAFIEYQKQEIIKKAKEKGYSIKEEKVQNKIKLVLYKATY